MAHRSSIRLYWSGGKRARVEVVDTDRSLSPSLRAYLRKRERLA